jgi:fructose-bisphosphate aldolase, class I
MNTDLLKETAAAMVAKGKGVLAADESTPTCTKRLDGVGVESTEENRRKYRGMLLTAPGIEDYISGVILFDETLRQKSDDGTPFPKVLSDRGIFPGIKVDKSTKDLPAFPGEKHTAGLDGLRERLAEYVELGAKFVKWRGVIVIDTETNLPTATAVNTNAHELAMYAAFSQEAGLVPIVEPEILINGSHTIEQCEGISTKVLKVVFEQLKKHKVYLEGMILKPSMVISGQDCPTQATKEEVAAATIRSFKEAVPAEVAGIAFLSGGQSETQATENLNEINKQPDLSWNMTFSFGRALQDSALKKWAEDPGANVAAAQAILLEKAEKNGAATKGVYAG